MKVPKVQTTETIYASGKIDTAVLLRQPKVIDTETGLLVAHPYDDQRVRGNSFSHQEHHWV